MEKAENLSHAFLKKIRESNVFTNKEVKYIIPIVDFTKKNLVRENFSFFHTTLWKLRKFTLTEKIFRQITYLVISLVKLLLSRNFCQKCVSVPVISALYVCTLCVHDFIAKFRQINFSN